MIKKIWKLVNEIIAIKTSLNKNDKLFEALTNFLSEVGKYLSTKIKPSPTTYTNFIKQINSKNSLFLTPTDAYEIKLLIINLKMIFYLFSLWHSIQIFENNWLHCVRMVVRILQQMHDYRWIPGLLENCPHHCNS